MEIDFFNDGRKWEIDTFSIKVGEVAWKVFKQVSGGDPSDDFFDIVKQAADDMLHRMTEDERAEFKASLRMSDIQRILALGFGMPLPDAK